LEAGSGHLGDEFREGREFDGGVGVEVYAGDFESGGGDRGGGFEDGVGGEGGGWVGGGGGGSGLCHGEFLGFRTLGGMVLDVFSHCCYVKKTRRALIGKSMISCRRKAIYNCEIYLAEFGIELLTSISRDCCSH